MARTTPIPEILYVPTDTPDATAIDSAFDYLFDLLITDEGGSLLQG